MESTEINIRSSMYKVGSILLGKLLNSDAGGYKGRPIPCKNGHFYQFKEYRDKKVLTVVSVVKIKRSYYYDKECKHGYCPKDKELDIEKSSFSPGVRRIVSRVGAYRPFALGHEDIKEMSGIDVDIKEVERVAKHSGKEAEAFFDKESAESQSENIIPIKKVPKMYICMDGTGVPVVKKETKGRKGKSEDGIAETREVKFGCVFTQTVVDDKGFPVRDEGSTSYTGGIENAEVKAIRNALDS